MNSQDTRANLHLRAAVVVDKNGDVLWYGTAFNSYWTTDYSDQPLNYGDVVLD